MAYDNKKKYDNEKSVSKNIFQVDAGWSNQDKSRVSKFKMDLLNGNLIMSITPYDANANKFGKQVGNVFFSIRDISKLHEMLTLADIEIRHNPESTWSIELENAKKKSFGIIRRESKNGENVYTQLALHDGEKTHYFFLEEKGNFVDKSGNLNIPPASVGKIAQMASILHSIMDLSSVRYDNHLKEFLGGNDSPSNKDNDKGGSSFLDDEDVF